MKRFLIMLGLFSAIMALVDWSLGSWLEVLSENSKGGENYRINYIYNHSNEDILIFGSSRALYHYNAQIIEDSTALSCYNCGMEGGGIISAYGMYSVITKRYYPRYIIYDAFDLYDLLKYEDNERYLSFLKPFYSCDGVAEIFDSVDRKERLKMLSHLYRYNSTFMQIFLESVHPLQRDGNKGYRPIPPGPLMLRHVVKRTDGCGYDPLKLYYLNRLIQESRGHTKLIFFVSPSYGRQNGRSYALLRKICRENNIPYVDYSGSGRFCGKDRLFADDLHLNRIGADDYSRMVAEILRKLIKR